MNRLFFSLVVLGLAGQAGAVPGGMPIEALILPVETTGTYANSDAQLTDVLSARLQKLAPNAKLQVARANELNVTKYKTGQDRPPTPSEAEELARTYKTNVICWVDVNFNPSFQADTSTLAMAGAARVWAYSTKQHRVTLDQPLSLVRTAVIKDVNAVEPSQAAAEELIANCMNDLGTQLFSIASQRARQAPQQVNNWPAQATPPKAAPSPNYSSMMKAINDYQRAVRDQSYIDQSTIERDLYYKWVTLNGDEQRQISQDYPGIAQMMTAPPAYGGGYWPYMYGPGYR